MKLLINKSMTPKHLKYLTDDNWNKIVNDYGLDVFSVCKFSRKFHSHTDDGNTFNMVQHSPGTFVSEYRNPKWRQPKKQYNQFSRQRIQTEPDFSCTRNGILTTESITQSSIWSTAKWHITTSISRTESNSMPMPMHDTRKKTLSNTVKCKRNKSKTLETLLKRTKTIYKRDKGQLRTFRPKSFRNAEKSETLNRVKGLSSRNTRAFRREIHWSKGITQTGEGLWGGLVLRRGTGFHWEFWWGRGR